MTFLKYIVTGTGRCGTVYMARVLTSLGVPCGHESIFNQAKPGVIEKRVFGERKPTMSKCAGNHGWVHLNDIVADSSYMALPYLNKFNLQDVPVIHVVRNPLSVISSFIKDLQYFQGLKENPFNKRGWEQWMWHHCKSLSSVENPIERACSYLLEWNGRIEKLGKSRPYYFHRAEDEFPDGFFEFLKVPVQRVVFKNKQINTMRNREKDLTSDDIPDGEIKNKFLTMMDRYGYTKQVFL